jgi:hypothetical protein
MRETYDYPIDENGVWAGDDEKRSLDMGVYCLDCGARHTYDDIHESGDHYTIALEANSDPEPAATIAIAFRGGVIDAIGADRLTGLLAIDEDRQEIGRFLARPDENEWWQRVKALEARIQKGESRASFVLDEEGKESVYCGECGMSHREPQCDPERTAGIRRAMETIAQGKEVEDDQARD